MTWLVFQADERAMPPGRRCDQMVEIASDSVVRNRLLRDRVLVKAEIEKSFETPAHSLDDRNMMLTQVGAIHPQQMKTWHARNHNP